MNTDNEKPYAYYVGARRQERLSAPYYVELYACNSRQLAIDMARQASTALKPGEVSVAVFTLAQWEGRRDQPIVVFVRPFPYNRDVPLQNREPQ